MNKMSHSVVEVELKERKNVYKSKNHRKNTKKEAIGMRPRRQRVSFYVRPLYRYKRRRVSFLISGSYKRRSKKKEED